MILGITCEVTDIIAAATRADSVRISPGIPVIARLPWLYLSGELRRIRCSTNTNRRCNRVRQLLIVIYVSFVVGDLLIGRRVELGDTINIEGEGKDAFLLVYSSEADDFCVEIIEFQRQVEVLGVIDTNISPNKEYR